MADVMFIRTLEELKQFLNEKGVLEIAVRNKNKRFRIFQKIALDQLQGNQAVEKVNNVAALLNKNNAANNNGVKMLNGIAKLNQMNLVLSALNLCATCVGFAIMYAKLDRMSSQIAEVVAVYKKGETIHTDYEFKKILSEHSNMLDCRRKQHYYTEEQMRELVDGEFNVLGLLIDVFLAEISTNREDLLFSILALAQMLSVSIQYFDEVYYYKNKDFIGDGDPWHMSHDNWVAVFDRLTSPEFMKYIQDCGIFEMGLNTVENDCFTVSFSDQIKSLKKDIEDNQAMIRAIDDKELFESVVNRCNEEIRDEIEAALKEAGVPLEVCENALRAATT